MELNARQKEAVEYIEGPLLVLAGPGTGKTQLLSQKVAYILKNTDTAPESILCVTFTDSGAMNMRERLKSILGRDGLKVNVSTYHVLGQEILTQYRQYSEEYSQPLTETLDEVTQHKIIRGIQQNLPGKDILRGDKIGDIIATISEAKSAMLTPDDLEEIAKQNLEDAEVLSGAVATLLENVVPRKFQESYERAYQPIYELLKDYTELEPIRPRVERMIAPIARDLKAAIIEAESTGKIPPLTNWRDDYFEKDGDNNWRLKGRVANKKLLSVAKVMRQYEEYLRENALHDFDDMIQEAVRILHDDEGFRLTMSERYQVVMLDEFQDTNPSQFQIIKYLTAYEKPLIMAVGDDDQGIYEFQGALSTNLMDFQAHYEAKVITLVENYRSTQEILDFSHHIAEQIPAAERFEDKELSAHKPAPKTSQIWRHEFWSSDGEYAWVAEKIAELIKSGVSQNEIAVISYQTKYFLPLLPYLKAHPEINIAYEKQDNLLENQRIHEILTICKYVWELAHERKVDTPLMEILSYPWLKLPMLEVVELANAARRAHKGLFEAMSESENPAIVEVATWLANLVAKSLTEPLEVFLDYVMGVEPLSGYTSQFLSYYTAQGDYGAWMLYEALAALKGKISKHFGEKPLRVSDLVEMINDYEEAGMALNSTSPYKDAEEAVSILSAHKAKGLEFEHVFLISLDHAAWGKAKGNNNLLSLPKNLAFIRHTGVTDGEKLRILYVALTRAKTHLYLTNSLHDFLEKSPERLEYLGEYKDGDKIISPYLPSHEVILDYAEEGSAEQSSEKTGVERLKYWLRPYVALNPDMHELYLSKIRDYQLSHTAMTGFIDIIHSGPVEFFKTYILQVPREPETEKQAYGTLVHAAFEAVTNQKITDEEAVQLFLSELEKRDLSVEAKAALREKGPADLTVALKKFSEILRQGQAEVDFYAEHLVVNGIPVTGKIDHMIIDEAAKTIEIYDFKTASFKKGKWASDPTLYKYMLQLLFYKMLLNHSREYSKYKVTRAHVLFVTPDHDNVVYDKPYDFPAEDEKAFYELLEAVYKEISSLDFMNDLEIFIEPNKNRKIKDLQDFITLLLAKSGVK